MRQYEVGDPLSRVHWKATARTGKLHCKVYEPSTVAGVTILLDFHTASHDPRNEPMRSELAVTAAASLANAVYEMGQQVGLVTNGRDAADRIRQEGWDYDIRTRDAARQAAGMAETSDRLRPVVVETRRGPDQVMRIFETLARIELTDGLNLAQLIGETASRMPRDATVVAILPMVTEEHAVALGNLKRRGFAVTAVLNLYDDVRLRRRIRPARVPRHRDPAPPRRARHCQLLPAPGAAQLKNPILARQFVPGAGQGIGLLRAFLDDQALFDQAPHRRSETVGRDPAFVEVDEQHFRRSDLVTAKQLQDSHFGGAHRTFPPSGEPTGADASESRRPL